MQAMRGMGMQFMPGITMTPMTSEFAPEGYEEPQASTQGPRSDFDRISALWSEQYPEMDINKLPSGSRPGSDSNVEPWMVNLLLNPVTLKETPYDWTPTYPDEALPEGVESRTDPKTGRTEYFKADRYAGPLVEAPRVDWRAPDSSPVKAENAKLANDISKYGLWIDSRGPGYVLPQNMERLTPARAAPHKGGGNFASDVLIPLGTAAILGNYAIPGISAGIGNAVGSQLAGNVLGNAAVSGTISGVMGGDPVKAALSGGLSGAMSGLGNLGKAAGLTGGALTLANNAANAYKAYNLVNSLNKAARDKNAAAGALGLMRGYQFMKGLS